MQAINEITLELAAILYEHANGECASDGEPSDAELWAECERNAAREEVIE